MLSVPVAVSAILAGNEILPKTVSVIDVVSLRSALNVEANTVIVSVAVEVSDNTALNTDASTVVESVTAAVSKIEPRYANDDETVSVPVAVSEIDPRYVTPPDAAKIQPSEPKLVEFAPAYHVDDRLYARTLEIDR